MGAEDTQTAVLRAYTVLASIRPDWSGALIVNLGLDPTGEALSFAANVAGAVCLSLESNPALLRNSQRSGSCDFIVNSLDEALRPIKNELRKHRPLSVALQGDPTTHLAEIIARGVAPELFTSPTTHPEAAAHFRSFGSQTVSFTDAVGPESPAASKFLEAFLAAHPYQLHTQTFSTSSTLRAFDTQALAQLDANNPDDTLRRQWLLTAPRILPRDRHRTLWLTPEEAAALAFAHSSPAQSS